jgi:hypothetical protein
MHASGNLVRMFGREVVDRVVKFMYNRSPIEIFEAVYGSGHHESYVEEKLHAMKNLVHWWGSLDNEHQHVLVQKAWNYYDTDEDDGSPEVI